MFNRAKKPWKSKQTDTNLDTAAYFSCYRTEAQDIGALFLSEISNSPGGSRKINLVYILHEIILTTLDMGDDFIKAFGDNLRSIVDSIW